MSFESFRVVRVSTITGRTLKVIASGLTMREAQLFASGFGQDDSPRTTIRVESEGR